jgi:hypothetical protein
MRASQPPLKLVEAHRPTDQFGKIGGRGGRAAFAVPTLDRDVYPLAGKSDEWIQPSRSHSA